MKSPGELQPIRFGVFELDVDASELRRQGLKLRLPEQPLRVLQMLLANPGRLVTREELRKALWPANSYVDFDQGLNRAVNKLREALGDSAESPRLIETVAKRGYRFIGDLSEPSREIRSLLVLPLENLSQDPEQGYFAEGLTEVLTTTLAKISALRVLSRTTGVFYKHAQKPLPEIARELGIDGVIEGSVLRSDGRVRISVQLLHAPTDTHLWAEVYERDMRDILALQTEVASAIAREIRVRLTPREQAQLSHRPVVDPDAFDACLRGRYFWDKRTPAAIAKAIQLFEQAIARDPGFAAPHAGLAECFSALSWWSYVPPEKGFAKAKRLALQTLEADPNLAEAHAALAWAVQHYDYDFQTAESELRRAIDLDPNYSLSRYRLAMTLAHLGRFDEAITEVMYALKLDPFGVNLSGAVGWVYMVARQNDQLLAYAKRSVELHPDVPLSHWAVGFAYLETGNFEAAIAELRIATQLSDATFFRALLTEVYAVAGRNEDALELLRQLHQHSGERFITPYMFGRIYTALGAKDDAFHWLDVAYRERAPWMVLLKRDPRLDGLRRDRRYEDLVKRMNYPS
jgi:TolB-like protein/Flp pilus assembly protein TadD